MVNGLVYVVQELPSKLYVVLFTPDPPSLSMAVRVQMTLEVKVPEVSLIPVIFSVVMGATVSGAPGWVEGMPVGFAVT